MAVNDERMQILELIESGKISAAEGLQLLQSLSESDRSSQNSALDQTDIEVEGPEEPILETASFAYTGEREVEGSSFETDHGASPAIGEVHSHPGQQNQPAGLPPEAEKWRRWWIIPLWIGVGLIVLAGSLMYAALQSSGMGFWFLCAGSAFTFGLIVTVLAWQSRTARWLHLRIQQRPGQSPGRIALSFPLPIRLTAWFFRTFRDRIPGMQHTSLDEIILALDHTATPENPVFISVNDEEEGESVQIFIG